VAGAATQLVCNLWHVEPVTYADTFITRSNYTLTSSSNEDGVEVDILYTLSLEDYTFLVIELFVHIAPVDTSYVGRFWRCRRDTSHRIHISSKRDNIEWKSHTESPN
jgi:hypothetical protein